MDEPKKAGDSKFVSNILIGVLMGIAAGIILLGAQGVVNLRGEQNNPAVHAAGHDCAVHGHVHSSECAHAAHHDCGHHHHGKECNHQHHVASDCDHADCDHAHHACDHGKNDDAVKLESQDALEKDSCACCDHAAETDKIN